MQATKTVNSLSQALASLTLTPEPLSDLGELPFDLIGHIATFLPSVNDCARLTLVSTRFASIDALRLIYATKVVELASKIASFASRRQIQIRHTGLSQVQHLVSALVRENCTMTAQELGQLLPLLPNLKTLRLSEVPLTTEHLDQIAKITALRSLTFKMCDLTDAAVAKLGSLESLDYLSLIGNPEITSFDALPTSLREFVCTQCKVDDAAVEKLSRLTRLYRLVLYGNSAITGSTLPSLADSIRELALCQSSRIGDAAVRNLSHLTALEKLDLSDNGGLVQPPLDTLPQTLRVLWLANCSLEPSALEGISGLPSLVSLKVSGNASVGPSALRAIPSSVKIS